MPKRVFLVDDHVVVRQGLKALLQQEGYEVVGEASNGHEAIQRIEAFSPDVAVLDLAMPLLNGIDAAREIRKICPRTRILLLTMFTESRFVLESLRAGINGYVLKTKAADELVHAIEETLKGGTYLSPDISGTVVQAYLSHEDPAADPLSTRERQVLQLVAEGKTTKEIAGVLGVSVKTAESHRTNIMEKLNIHDTAGLVRYAIRTGLISS